jgi:hypothetical protein
VHVRVDQARHQRAAGKVDHLGFAHHRPRLRRVADAAVLDHDEALVGVGPGVDVDDAGVGDEGQQ